MSDLRKKMKVMFQAKQDQNRAAIQQWINTTPISDQKRVWAALEAMTGDPVQEAIRMFADYAVMENLILVEDEETP